MRIYSFFLLLILSPLDQLSGAVLEQSELGFTIEITATVAVEPDVAYRHFVDVAQWWDADHSWFGKAENFSIDAQAGGCFCEIDGDRQVMHMLVSYIDPGKEIRMLGGLGPLQMMAVNGAMTWVFEANGEQQTTITHRYTVSGAIDTGLAEIVDKVQNGQVQRLAERINASSSGAQPNKP